MAWNKSPKYKNKKVEVDGIVFDSKKEANRYQELQTLARYGAIRDLSRQVKFDLIPAQYAIVDGKKKCIERKCVYTADFTYWDVDNQELIVEDTKGFRTKDYIIKRKLMLYIHGIRIQEI